MRRLALLLTLIAMPALAQPESPMLQALRARNWPAAQALAGDALGQKLVTFIRLLMPDQATAPEILDFLNANPTWPDRPVLEQRYADALSNEPDEASAATLCQSHPPQDPKTLLRCAEAYAATKNTSRATAAARTAWVEGLAQPDEEAAFLTRWARLPTSEDQRRRFDHLAPTNPAAAQRQLARLDPDYAHLGGARLAFRHQDANALSFLAAVPESLRTDPALLLEEARFLRRTHADSAASALWHSAVIQAEAHLLPPDRRGPYWSERDILARELLADHQPQDAYAIANDTSLATDQSLESDFLAGWIALTALHDPALARTHFLALSARSQSAITQSRAKYWLAHAAPDAAGTRTYLQQAAAWPLTYYGQKAARENEEPNTALYARIAALRDPLVAPAEAAQFQASELFRAATILVNWQDPKRAADFYQRLIQPPATLGQRTLVAQAALRDGLPDIAVLAARLSGRDGTALPQSGWPIPVQPPPGPVPAALVLAIMRQESSFDPKIISTAGAQGLMQLMPQTAAQLARTNHIAASPLGDPTINMRLGTLYFADLINRFALVPVAIAAYNAGPHRVQQWLDAAAPASGDADAMTGWIESIPFAETRNYVQRVLENETIYEARLKK